MCVCVWLFRSLQYLFLGFVAFPVPLIAISSCWRCRCRCLHFLLGLPAASHSVSQRTHGRPSSAVSPWCRINISLYSFSFAVFIFISLSVATVAIKYMAATREGASGAQLASARKLSTKSSYFALALGPALPRDVQ